MDKTFICGVSFANIDRARRLLCDLKHDESGKAEQGLITELQDKIADYERFVESDLEAALRVKN